MAGNRPFRFGVHTSDAATGAAWAAAAQRYEAIGFSTLLLRDHFDEQLAPSGHHSCEAPEQAPRVASDTDVAVHQQRSRPAALTG